MIIFEILYEIVVAICFIVIVCKIKENQDRIEELEKEIKQLKGEENKDE